MNLKISIENGQKIFCAKPEHSTIDIHLPLSNIGRLSGHSHPGTHIISARDILGVSPSPFKEVQLSIG